MAWRAPFPSLAAGLAAWEQAAPQAPATAFVTGGRVRRRTRSETAAAVRAAAARLAEAGVAAGQRVWLAMDDGPEAAVLALAVLLRGASLVPVGRRALPGGMLPLPVSWTVGAEAPGAVSLAADELLRPHPRRPDLPDTSREAEALVAFTSGTSGAPRAVRVAGRGLWFSAASSARFLPRPAGGAVLLRHVFEFDRLQIYTLLTALLAGAVMAGSGGDLSAASLAALGVTVLRATPSTFARLRAEVGEGPGAGRRLRARLGGRVRHGISSGAPLEPALAAWWQAHGVPLLQHYGSTETGVVALHSPRGADPGTVGRVVPGARVRVGGNGSLEVRTPGLMLGYEGEAPPPTWFCLGERGEVRADGHLVVHGRPADFLQTSRGRKIHRGRVENALAAQDPICGAFLLGEGRPWPLALLLVRRGAVAGWEAAALSRALEDAFAAALAPLAEWERPRGALAFLVDAAPPAKAARDAVAREAAALLEPLWTRESPGVHLLAETPSWLR